jgi:urease accessory protein
VKRLVMKRGAISRLELIPNILLLSDSALPTGGFAHSYGMETFICRGATNVIGLLRTFIHEELGKVDLPAFVIAYRATRRSDLSGLKEIDQTVNAMKIPREWREAGVQTGRRLITVSEVLDGEQNRVTASEFWLQYCKLVKSSGVPGQHAVVAGALDCLLGFSLDEAALAYAVSVLKNLVSALVRLVPLGQTEGLRIQCSLHEELVAIAQKATLITNPDQLGGFAPELELAGMQHEQLYTRLFIS